MRDEAQAHFERWFADSKVVDADGAPLVVYHGTQRDVSSFQGRRARAWASNNVWGSFFTRSAQTASAYSNEGPGSNVMPVYLSLQSPYIMDCYEWQDFHTPHRRNEAKLLKKRLLQQGHDGIIDNARVEYVAFWPDQIKSAIGNSGLFAKGNPDITDRRVEAALGARAFLDGLKPKASPHA